MSTRLQMKDYGTVLPHFMLIQRKSWSVGYAITIRNYKICVFPTVDSGSETHQPYPQFLKFFSFGGLTIIFEKTEV